MSIRVKFVSRVDPREWTRYFPGEDGRWGACHFLFDRDERHYDWLVAYDDVAPAKGQNRESAHELLACPDEQTLLVTTEPSSIKAYGKAFAAQFGHVLTSQPAWALPHRRRHFQQAANHWFYGSAPDHWMDRKTLVAGPSAADKAGDISAVFSAKRQSHTLHAQRYRFIQALVQQLPEIELFGRGARPMNDKAEALSPFRYHLAVENHVAPHHITEKLTDCFLGRCLPFYVGAPNAADYFPEGSFIPLDIDDPVAAARTIRDAIRDNAWEKRLHLIDEARRRVLEEHHLFAVIERIVRQSGSATVSPSQRQTIYGRHAWRRKFKLSAARYMAEKVYVRARAIAEKHRFHRQRGSRT